MPSLKKLKLDYVNKLISKWFFDYFEIVIEKITKDDILSAISKLKYNLLTQHLTELNIEDPYKKLRPKDNFSMQRMNSLITEWENDPKLETEIDKVFSIQGAPIKEEE